MITELALLRLQPGSEMAFEAAFNGVASMLQRTAGCPGNRLAPALEDRDLYLLEGTWRDLAAHVEVFESSEDHARFMAELEPFLHGDALVVHVPFRDQCEAVQRL